MTRREDVALSKYLSWVLRHAPDAAGLRPTTDGWVPLEALVAAVVASGRSTTVDRIRQIVADSDKRRFALSEDGTMIRAQQGHSIPVDLGYEAAAPPAVLFHGTHAAALASIQEQGLRKGERHHVHLSPDIATAQRVGGRRGKAIVLTVRAHEMVAAGYEFMRTPNDVWLVDHVPPQYLDAPPPTG